MHSKILFPGTLAAIAFNAGGCNCDSFTTWTVVGDIGSSGELPSAVLIDLYQNGAFLSRDVLQVSEDGHFDTTLSTVHGCYSSGPLEIPTDIVFIDYGGAQDRSVTLTKDQFTATLTDESHGFISIDEVISFDGVQPSANSNYKDHERRADGALAVSPVPGVPTQTFQTKPLCRTP
jgi:hypothetical protein